MAKRLKDVKIKVYRILEKYPKARDNDGTLIAHFLNEYHSRFVRRDIDGELCIRLKDFKHLPPFESIRRSRQLIQNGDGEFLPTNAEIRKARRIKEEQWHNWEVREAQNCVVRGLLVLNGVKTLLSTSKRTGEQYRTWRADENRVLCSCKGSQYGHECKHIKKFKSLEK